MNQDTLDQALRNEPEITPSPGFSHRVMRSVRREADLRQAIPFPWKPIAAGLAVTTALTLAGALGGGAPPAPALPADLAAGLGWLSTTLAASLGLVWWSVRFARR